jgi:hypothetical protein
LILDRDTFLEFHELINEKSIEPRNVVVLIRVEGLLSSFCISQFSVLFLSTSLCLTVYVSKEY